MSAKRKVSFAARAQLRSYYLYDEEIDDLLKAKNLTIQLLAGTLKRERETRRNAEDAASRLIHPDTTGR